MKTKDLLNIFIIVKEEYDGSSPDSKMFPVVFKNIFLDYVLFGAEKDKGYSSRTKTSNEDPFRLS